MSSVATDQPGRPEGNSALLDDLLTTVRIVRDHTDLRALTGSEVLRFQASTETIAAAAKTRGVEVYRTNAGAGFVNESVIVIDGEALRVVLHCTRRLLPGEEVGGSARPAVAAAERTSIEDADQERIAAMNDLYADARRGDLL